MRSIHYPSTGGRPSNSSQLLGDTPGASGKARGRELQRTVAEASHVDRAARPSGRPPVAVQEPGTVAEDRDLEPVAQRPVIADGDARPASGPFIRRGAFAVAGQPAEGADAPFDLVAREVRAVALPILAPQMRSRNRKCAAGTWRYRPLVLRRIAGATKNCKCYTVPYSAAAGREGLGGCSQGERSQRRHDE
jgi:hypothetical protein